MQLELSERMARILAVTPNAEIHGDDPKPVCYLRLECNLQGEDLAMFHPQLRGVFYQKNNRADADLAEQGQDATMLRVPVLEGPFKLNAEMTGGELRIHYGTSEKSHIVLSGIQVGKITLEPLEGGTVTMVCTVTTHPEEKQLGRLGMMVRAAVPVTITPPEADEEREDLAEAA